jgi:acyl dehydratase
MIKHEAPPAVGDAAPERRYGPLTQVDVVRYAGASGDFNPLHVDDAAARAAGFPSVFVMGLLPAGVLSGYLSDWLGPQRIRRFAVRFRAQVWPGDELICTGRVDAVEPTEGGRTSVRVSLICATERNGAVCTAEAEVVFD